MALLLGASAASARDDWRPGPGWDRDIDVRCESRGYGYNLCQVDIGRGGRVDLVDQTSGSDCIEGRTWGYNRAGVWVDNGCAGVFRIERRWADDRHGGYRDDDRRGDYRDDDRRGDWRPGNDFDQRIVVRCGSQNFHYNLCQVDTGRGSDVRLSRQISGSACVEGRTWGWNRAGIWVDRGCDAEFVVDRRWR
ncbi:DUF3011 domain-containing protein [Tahibacter caeni]|uniref:DUF3011 domain-containing protein n=1 Tax=Tahibacter caeni TaxID=1453545 RepID=UPI0021475522